MTKIKICGITNHDDAQVVVDSGADAIGFVFVPNTPRYISVEIVAEITEKIPPFITTVGLFANEKIETIRKITDQCNLDLIQLHGDEPPSICDIFFPNVLKAFRISDLSSLDPIRNYRLNAFLLDAFVKGKLGGTGEKFDWNLAKKAKNFGRIILAGGLHPENVAEAIATVRPFGVDVSSGVEISPGRKDRKKILQFVKNVRETDLEIKNEN